MGSHKALKCLHLCLEDLTVSQKLGTLLCLKAYKRYGGKDKYINNEFKLQIIKLKLPNVDLNLMLSTFSNSKLSNAYIDNSGSGLERGGDKRSLCAVKI